jgi:hypothetical protein
MVALALVLGGIGTEAAAATAHGDVNHAGAGQPGVDQHGADGHTGATHLLASSGSTSQRPWMY